MLEPRTPTTYPQPEAREADEQPRAADREEVEQWLQMSQRVQDPHAALEYAQRAADLQPDDPQVQESVQRSVFQRLVRDPFIAFLAETDRTYVITFRNSRPIVIPKSREQAEPFPRPDLSAGERVLGKVWWVALGLLPAGIGALILSPFVVRQALQVLSQKGLGHREERTAWLAIFLASGLGLLGTFFVLLLGLHLIG